MSKGPPYEGHPLALVFPPMQGEEYREFRESIKVQGQLEPILLDDQCRVVDGLNRQRACLDLDIEPVYMFRDFESDAELGDFIWSKNMSRRHVGPGQRAAIYCCFHARIAEIRQAAGERRDGALRGQSVVPQMAGRTRDFVAKGAGVSTGTAQKALAVATADAEALAQVAAGRVKLNNAYSQVRRTAEQEGTAGKLAVAEAEAAEHRTTPAWVVWSLLGRAEIQHKFVRGAKALDPFAGAGEIPSAFAAVLPMHWTMYELRPSCEPALLALSETLIGPSSVGIGDFFEIAADSIHDCEIAIFNPPFSKALEAVLFLFEYAPHADLWMLQRRNWIDQARVAWLIDHMPDEFVLPDRIRFGQAATGNEYQGTDNCLHSWYHWPANRRESSWGTTTILDRIESAADINMGGAGTDR